MIKMVLTFNRLLITLSCAFNLLNCGSCRLVVVNEMKLLQFRTSITGSNFKAISIFGENISLLCVFITLTLSCWVSFYASRVTSLKSFCFASDSGGGAKTTEEYLVRCCP